MLSRTKIEIGAQYDRICRLYPLTAYRAALLAIASATSFALVSATLAPAVELFELFNGGKQLLICPPVVSDCVNNSGVITPEVIHGLGVCAIAGYIATLHCLIGRFACKYFVADDHFNTEAVADSYFNTEAIDDWTTATWTGYFCSSILLFVVMVSAVLY